MKKSGGKIKQINVDSWPTNCSKIEVHNFGAALLINIVVVRFHKNAAIFYSEFHQFHSKISPVHI